MSKVNRFADSFRLKSAVRNGNLLMMTGRTFQLVLHYDGTDFAGWQVQPAERTVQGALEDALARLCGTPVRVTGAGRTDAGVHARGQAVGVVLPEHWGADRLRHAVNGQLPADIWVATTHEMQAGFHARFDATGRRYSYSVGLDEVAQSPFRRRFSTAYSGSIDRAALEWCARQVVGTHVFRGFAVRGTAPATDDHRCEVRECAWTGNDHLLAMYIEANRFLHHMVRFLVGTMLDVATHKRPREEFGALLEAATNDQVSPPAPPQGLCLEHVMYPSALYLTP